MTRITDEELRAIEARANAATAGPWAVVQCDGFPAGNRVFIAAAHPDRIDGPPIVDGDGTFSRRDPDAAFIAHARADVPRLVEEVRRLGAPMTRPTTPAPPPGAADLSALIEKLSDDIATARDAAESGTEDALALARCDGATWMLDALSRAPLDAETRGMVEEAMRLVATTPDPRLPRENVSRWVLECGCDPHVEHCAQCDERRAIRDGSPPFTDRQIGKRARTLLPALARALSGRTEGQGR